MIINIKNVVIKNIKALKGIVIKNERQLNLILFIKVTIQIKIIIKYKKEQHLQKVQINKLNLMKIN